MLPSVENRGAQPKLPSDFHPYHPPPPPPSAAVLLVAHHSHHFFSSSSFSDAFFHHLSLLKQGPCLPEHALLNVPLQVDDSFVKNAENRNGSLRKQHQDNIGFGSKGSFEKVSGATGVLLPGVLKSSANTTKATDWWSATTYDMMLACAVSGQVFEEDGPISQTDLQCRAYEDLFWQHNKPIFDFQITRSPQK